MEIKNCWTLYSEEQLNELENLNAKYRDFLDHGKTERECVDEIVNTIEAAGYRELEALIESGEIVKEGDKVIYSEYAGTKVKMDGEEVIIVRQADILAIVE